MLVTTLTLELPPELYARLRAEAERLGKLPEGVAQEWLSERLVNPPPASERDRARAALRAGGLLVESPLGPASWRRAESAHVTLEEVSADLERAGGKPLSEIV